MIDLCELAQLAAADPEAARRALDELLAVHAQQIALRPIDYKEPPEGFVCATP